MNTSLGKYRAYDTIIHRLDPRIKLIFMILSMVSVFLTYSNDNPFMNLTIYGLIFLMLLCLSWIAKVSFLSVLKSLAALWVMLIFVSVLNIFFISPGEGETLAVAFTIGSVKIYWLGIVNMLNILSRVFIVIIITNIFTSTTKPMEMTGALEWLLFPLSLVKVPVHKFAMAISLALRFVPTLQEETSRIMKAQASRGVDYSQGSFKEKVKSIVALIIPLFISAFTTSGQLADAMEARGYDPNAKRTRYQTRFWSMKDTLSVFFVCLYLAGMILLMIYQPDIYKMLNIVVPKVRS